MWEKPPTSGVRRVVPEDSWERGHGRHLNGTGRSGSKTWNMPGHWAEKPTLLLRYRRPFDSHLFKVLLRLSLTCFDCVYEVVTFFFFYSSVFPSGKKHS